MHTALYYSVSYQSKLTVVCSCPHYVSEHYDSHLVSVFPGRYLHFLFLRKDIFI